MAQRLSRNLQRESQELMSNFVDDTKADAVVHGFDDPSTTDSDVDVRNESILNNATLADDDWNSFVMMGDVADYSDDDSSSESSMPSRPATPLANLSLEDAMSDWIAEFLWEMCTSGLGNPKYTFSAQPPAALSPQIKTILARIPFRASPCSLYLALWYTSRLPVSFHLPHFAFPPGSPQYDFYMDFIGLSKNSNTSLPEGPEAAPYRLFCLGLFFAYKWLEEYDMKSSVWCDIFKLPPRVLNSLEMNALRIFEHSLAIDELEWMRWLLELQCDRPAFPSISRIRPSDVDAARRVSLDWLLDHTCLPISNEGSGSWFHPSSSSRSSSPSPSASPVSGAVPVPEAYFIGKSERILTKRLMLERELAQLGMTEEEYDAEEDHTPICTVEESLRRVLDSAEAYRAAEDARLAKAARKEAERLRIEGEKERIRQERERMERERLERQKRREEAKREEARKAEEAARKAREAQAEEEAKAKRIALAAQAEAEVLAKAIEDNKAKKNAWRSQYKWDVAPSRPLPPVPTTNSTSSSAATKRTSPTTTPLKRPSPSRASPPSSRRRGSFSSDSSSTSSTSSFSSKPTSGTSTGSGSALFIKPPSSSTYVKAPAQSAPATTTGFGAPTFSSSAKANNSGFHRNFSSSAYQRHAQAQRAANMFGTVFVPLKRTGSHGSAGINVGSNSTSWRKEKREEEEGWMEMV